MARASRKSVDVLIAGAGPTGLALALWLARSGVSVRIVDKAAEVGTTSRALAVQARTLEFYRQLGLADDCVARGLKMEAVNLWVRGEKAARLAVGDIGQGISPFPYVLILPQDEHERMLIEHLKAAGVEVERPVELLGFEEGPEAVQARLKRANGREEVCEASFICGCDGARSVLRSLLHTGFAGGTYVQLFYVADVKARGPMLDKELHVALDDADFLAIFPLKADGTARLIGAVRQDATAQSQAGLRWEDVSGTIVERLGIEVQKVNWFSTYHVHHRVAGSFRKGRAFLLGDAAHIHSPAGGQGMNTGIGDAINLGWKLAAVIRGRADPKLLDTYEPERIGFARKLVATTDQVFTFATKPGFLAKEVRTGLAPRVIPVLFGTEMSRQFAFRTVSQTAIQYHKSALSRGGAGHVVGGDRLPWSGEDSCPGGGDNFTPLMSLDWQVHVHGQASNAVQDVCAAWSVPLREFPWNDAFWRAGFMHDALYLVRPDGHVALAEPNGRAQALERYLESWGIGPGA
jgi:2-polyprenyl-6-methoxyphenol hydroxylase-like FAD-dependent oxidoreductase